MAGVVGGIADAIGAVSNAIDHVAERDEKQRDRIAAAADKLNEPLPEPSPVTIPEGVGKLTVGSLLATLTDLANKGKITKDTLVLRMTNPLGGYEACYSAKVIGIHEKDFEAFPAFVVGD